MNELSEAVVDVKIYKAPDLVDYEYLHVAANLGSLSMHEVIDFAVNQLHPDAEDYVVRHLAQRSIKYLQTEPKFLESVKLVGVDIERTIVLDAFGERVYKTSETIVVSPSQHLVPSQLG